MLSPYNAVGMKASISTKAIKIKATKNDSKGVSGCLFIGLTPYIYIAKNCYCSFSFILCGGSIFTRYLDCFTE